MDFRDPLALLIGLSSCLMGSSMPRTPGKEFSTHPLKLFSLVSERFLEFTPHVAKLWQLSLTSEHRRASANMDNPQTLQIQLHLSKEREEKHAVNKKVFKIHSKISILTAFALYQQLRCGDRSWRLQPALHVTHNFLVSELSPSDLSCP